MDGTSVLLPLLRPPVHPARHRSSFVYRTFLGVSPAPEALFVSALSDPAYVEIDALVSSDGRAAGLAPMDAAQLIRSEVGRAYDPDNKGAPLDFNGTTPCPQGASVQIELLGETGVGWPGTVRQASHRPALRREGNSRGARPECPTPLSSYCRRAPRRQTGVGEVGIFRLGPHPPSGTDTDSPASPFPPRRKEEVPARANRPAPTDCGDASRGPALTES